jgi:hypothetical protein
MGGHSGAPGHPAKFAQIAYVLLPKDIFVRTEAVSPGDLTPAEWASLRRVIDLIGRYAAAGAEPEPIFEQIERALQLAYEPRAIPPCPVPLPATETASASNAKNRTI